MLTADNKDRFIRLVDIAKDFMHLNNTEDAIRTLRMAINEIEDANDENSKYFINVKGKYYNVKDVVVGYINGNISKVNAIKMLGYRTGVGTAQASEFLRVARLEDKFMIPENNETKHSMMKRIHIRTAIMETIQEYEYFSHVIGHSPWTHDNVIDVTIEWIKSNLFMEREIDIEDVIHSIVGEDSQYVNVPIMSNSERIAHIYLYIFVQEITEKLFDFH